MHPPSIVLSQVFLAAVATPLAAILYLSHLISFAQIPFRLHFPKGATPPPIPIPPHRTAHVAAGKAHAIY